MSVYDVCEPIDVYHARRRAGAVFARLGFSSPKCLELVIVVSELATNILKYGVRGSIAVGPVWDALRGAGVEVVARDEGPSFFDLASALRDGHDDRGPIDPEVLAQREGLGSGLGAVQRFSDVLRVEPAPVGKRIVVRRYLRPAAALLPPR